MTLTLSEIMTSFVDNEDRTGIKCLAEVAPEVFRR